MMGSQERQREKPNQLKEPKVKSLEFFKPTLATTLAILLASLLSVRPAQAGYAVTLRQVGPDVVATGSGAIDLTGLTLHELPFFNHARFYSGRTIGPTSFGGFPLSIPPSSSSGDRVRIAATGIYEFSLFVPTGYVSGTFLSGSVTYSGNTLASLGVTPASLGVTPGTYVWKWGSGANQNFTLQIKTPVLASTAIWYFNKGASASAPTLPAGWIVVGMADFNGDSQPDYLLYNTSTHQTVVWYLDNNVFVRGAFSPTLPVNWRVVGVADFNGDNKPDYLLFNSSTRQTAIWYLSGLTLISGTYGPSIASGYTLIGAADFDRDGKPDYVLYGPSVQ